MRLACAVTCHDAEITYTLRNQSAKLRRDHAIFFTHALRIITQLLRKSFTQQLRMHYSEITQINYAHYANITQRLRKEFTQSLRNFTQRLRTIYAKLLRNIRKHYANMFTQALRKFPMLTHLHYTDITQILIK